MKERNKYILNQLDMLAGTELIYDAKSLIILLDGLVDIDTIKHIQPNKFTATTVCGDNIDINVSIVYNSIGENTEMLIETICLTKPSVANSKDEFDEI